MNENSPAGGGEAPTKTKRAARAAAAIPSFYNHDKSVSPSDALFEAVLDDLDSDGKPIVVPLTLMRQTLRGVMGSYGSLYGADFRPKSASDLTKEVDPENANIQRVDSARLPPGAKRFRISFTVGFAPNSRTPGACNQPAFRKKVDDLTRLYSEKDGYRHLAERYAWNLANGRWMWRNRFALDKLVTITSTSLPDEGAWSFSPDNVDDLHTYPPDFHRTAQSEGLVTLIAEALSGKSRPLFLKIVGEGTLSYGQEVFPSQEFEGDGKGEQRKKKGRVSRVLAGHHLPNGERQAVFHSQKIGNALRTIDGWHDDMSEYGVGVIPVEPSGFIQSHSKAIRLPNDPQAKGRDFYAILKDIDGMIATLASVDTAVDDSSKELREIHYAMAVLVRGGVFSMTTSSD